jgi:hypothetical protein
MIGIWLLLWIVCSSAPIKPIISEDPMSVLSFHLTPQSSQSLSREPSLRSNPDTENQAIRSKLKDVFLEDTEIIHLSNHDSSEHLEESSLESFSDVSREMMNSVFEKAIGHSSMLYLFKFRKSMELVSPKLLDDALMYYLHTRQSVMLRRFSTVFHRLPKINFNVYLAIAIRNHDLDSFKVIYKYVAGTHNLKVLLKKTAVSPSIFKFLIHHRGSELTKVDFVTLLDFLIEHDLSVSLDECLKFMDEKIYFDRKTAYEVVNHALKQGNPASIGIVFKHAEVVEALTRDNLRAFLDSYQSNPFAVSEIHDLLAKNPKPIIFPESLEIY